MHWLVTQSPAHLYAHGRAMVRVRLAAVPQSPGQLRDPQNRKNRRLVFKTEVQVRMRQHQKHVPVHEAV